MVVGVVNATALALFAFALCWRIDRLRRENTGFQPVAMTVAISATTLGFVVANKRVRDWLNEDLFPGAGRLFIYCLLAIGVAALVVVFFYASTEEERQRRAGVEAVPLVTALIGLNVAILATPIPIRTQPMSDWTVHHVGYAVFFVIADCYVAYGLCACVLSIRRYVRHAEGYLRHSLIALSVGLALMGLAALMQTGYVILAGLHIAHLTGLLTGAGVLAGSGAALFLLGIGYPLMRSRVMTIRYDVRHRRHYRELEPLWSLTTSALPGVVLPAPRKGEFDGSIVWLFQRRVVEIRDALLQLSPYLPADFDDLAPAGQATAIREATQRYRAIGGSSGSVGQVLAGAGDDLDSDAAPLLRLSRELAVDAPPTLQKQNRTG
jgi:hypothetical protein